MNVKARRRGRSAWLGILVILLLALGTCGYRLTFSPSASTGPGKNKPSATPSTEVLAPQGPERPGDSPSTSSGSGTTSPGSATGTQLVLAPAGTGNGNAGNCVEPSNGNGNCEKSFGVTVGQTQALYPGVTRDLPVTFSNPNSFAIFVTSYRVSVPASTAAACAPSSLQVPNGTVTLSPRLTAPKNGSVSTTVPIELSADAPEACKQVTFTITVNASAVKK